MNKEVIECVSYFRNHKGFHRLLCGIRDKYISLARCGGTVTLVNPTSAEKSDLEGFFGRNYASNKTITISAERFQKQLSETRFSKVTLEELLEAYFEETLESKGAAKEREEQEWNAFLDEIHISFVNTFSGNWLQNTREQKSDSAAYTFLKQFYKEDKELLRVVLKAVMCAADQFPAFEERTKMLAVFAAETTGDPHYFDEGTKANRLLSYLMEAYVESCRLCGKDEDTRQKNGSVVEKKTQLMYHAGLAKDDISNRTVLYGIHLRMKNGKLHRGIEGFIAERQPVTVMLKQMSEVESAYGEDKRIYVFENPSVFSAFVEKTGGDKKIGQEISAVCTNGQLTLTSLLLLDQLVRAGDVLYYAGDFDPEGLKIADNLKKRYGEKMVLWHYREEDYQVAKSEVVISDKRLDKLASVHSKELQIIVQLLRVEKRAGYQELLIESYVNEVARI